MEVEGIVIRFSDVDKQLEAIEQAEQAQPLVKIFIAFLVKCQRKVADQKGDVDVLSQELNYSVRKIVEKLAVGGPSPQFILALTEIISFFSVLSLSWLLSLLSEDANTGQQMAWVLMLAAATKSGKVTELVQKSKDPKKLSQITTVGKFLVEVAQSGGGLEELAFEGLFLLIEQLISFPDVLAKYLASSFVPLLDSKSWNFNTMTLVLKLNENFKNLDLTTHTSKLLNKKIINPANLELISSIFAYKIPKLDNQLWSLILKDVQDLPIGDKQTFVSGIWKTIAGSLASKKKDTKLLALFNWIWNLDEALQIPLLSDSLFIVLRRQQLSNNEDVTAIKEKIKEACTKNPKLVGSTVLLSFPEMAVDLSQKIVTPVVHQMVSNFYNHIQTPLRVAQALSQIARDTENSELALEILKFLFFHGFFLCKPNTTSKKPKAGKSLPKILGETLRPSISAQNPEKELGSSVLKQVQTLFFRAIVHRGLALVSLQTSRKEKKEKLSTIVSSPFTSIIEFRVLLSTLSDQVEPRRPQEEENDAVLTNAEKLISSAYKKLTQDTDGAKEFNAELDAFVVLLSVTYLIQLHDPVEPIETISDLIHCYQDVFESSKQKKANDDKNKEKAFAVLVDILISLQAKPMFLVGTLPEYCIKCFAKHLTAQSIDGIIKAITEYSLNKTEGDEESDEDEVDLMDDDEDEPAEGEKIEDEDENETDTANQTKEADDSSESDIYIDDLDDQTLMELDEVIAKIMQKERKPKMKQPPSNKEPDIEFRERVASLLHAFIKKTHTAAVVELLPQLLDVIFELQQQKRVQAQKADPKEGSKETKLEATQKRQQKNKFYNTVTSLINKSVMEICRTCGDVVEQLSAAKRASLSSVLLGHCSSTKGKEVSELAVESSLLLTKSPEQIISLLNGSAAKCSKQAVQYLVRRICLRFPLLVWTDPKLSALLIERYPKNVQAFVSSLDKEVLTQVGQNVVDKFVEQVKTKSDAKLLPIVRIIVLKMATLTNRDTVKEKFPELAFTLNTIIQTVSFGENHRKTAKQIATQALVGSQQSSKKREKAERKKRKLEEDKDKSDDEEEEAEADPNSKEVKWKKGDLFYTKNKAYQNSRKRKKVTDLDNTPKKKFAAKKKDTTWFKNK